MNMVEHDICPGARPEHFATFSGSIRSRSQKLLTKNFKILPFFLVFLSVVTFFPQNSKIFSHGLMGLANTYKMSGQT